MLDAHGRLLMAVSVEEDLPLAGRELQVQPVVAVHEPGQELVQQEGAPGHCLGFRVARKLVRVLVAEGEEA